MAYGMKQSTSGIYSGKKNLGNKIKSLIKAGQQKEGSFAEEAADAAGMKKQPGYKLKSVVSKMSRSGGRGPRARGTGD